MLLQNFGLTNKEHYGMFWYFWSGQFNLYLTTLLQKKQFVINHDGKYEKYIQSNSFWVSLLKFYRKVLATSYKLFVFNLTNCFPSKTFVHYFVTINNWTRLLINCKSFHKIFDRRYTVLDRSSMISCMVGLASGSVCRHRRTRPLKDRFVISRTCFSRLLGSGSCRMHISQRSTPKL